MIQKCRKVNSQKKCMVKPEEFSVVPATNSSRKKTTPHLEVSEPPKPYVSSLDSDSYMENLSVARSQKLLPVLRVKWRAHQIKPGTYGLKILESACANCSRSLR